jgi:3-hydroxybutyryl-CoA dehydrogenase
MEQIESIVVCGAGTMGAGIAQVSAVAGFPTILFDLNSSILEKADNQIRAQLNKMVEKGLIDEAAKQQQYDRLIFTSDIATCKADLIIEAIIEKEEAKTSLFQQLAAINGNATIYATNTSSISIDKLAKEFIYPNQFAGIHFFNPAPLMKLVEVIRGASTDEGVVDQLIVVAKRMKKIPVVCKDAPGFIVNRVARHFYLEAMYMLENGQLTIEQADAIMENAGFKMGPFKLMDLIGLDINYGVSNIVWEALDKPKRLTPSNIQKQKVNAGNLGRKTGKGFYNYL